MENHPTKHRIFGPERHRSPGLPLTTKTHHSPKKGSVADFLIALNFAPLVFVGRCLKQFGVGAVGGFLLGAVSVYGYAVVKGLPLPKGSQPDVAIVAAPPVQAKTVKLHGLVRDSDGKPVKEAFNVGVLAKQLGPVQNSDGSFEMEVPQSNSYDVALWNSDTVKVYTGFAAEKDGLGYRLAQALPFLHAITNVSALSSKAGAQLPQLQTGGPPNASMNVNPTADARLNSSLKSTNLASADLERRTK
jgi:hypothetical protein